MLNKNLRINFLKSNSFYNYVKKNYISYCSLNLKRKNIQVGRLIFILFISDEINELIKKLVQIK